MATPMPANVRRVLDTTMTAALLLVTLPFLVLLSSALTIRTAFRSAFPARPQ